jgi:ABC-type nitrate/sulfonate/bicarbonate transport system permease component
MKKLLTPLQETTKKTKFLIGLGWILFLLTMWGIYGAQGETHLFPTIGQVLTGFKELWSEGLMTHVISSLCLCGWSVFIAIIISLLFVYLSPIPLIKPVSDFLSKFRYLPLTGIAFYITMLINSARDIQVWILVIFMSTFLITSLLSMLKDIKEEEFDHARALGCNRFEILWEVIVKGRFDYVIENIRQNLAIVWMMLVTVESIMAAAGGLGFLIKNSDKFMNHGRIIALQIVILLVGLLLDFTLTKIRKTVFRYSNI